MTSDIESANSEFATELRHWRGLSQISQKELARRVGYTPSYVSKVENGAMPPSDEFVAKADAELRAGRALIRRWKECAPRPTSPAHHRVAAIDTKPAPTQELIVEHEHARLELADGYFTTTIRRLLRNVGEAPVTSYLIRISVDRYPGDPDRSNELYRNDPLTWEEIALTAFSGREPMTWEPKHDRDAFKEVWLNFENPDGRFPLYPGETAWIEYSYRVGERKWGPWWQRAIRVPTQQLNIEMRFPAEYDPAVWGIETSMTATASPLRSAITRVDDGDVTCFAWSTERPAIGARYRFEWKFRARQGEDVQSMATLKTPSERMRATGILQQGDERLVTAATPFVLPDEAEDLRRAVSQLVSTMDRAAQLHTFAKGMGIAAPQIGISRRVALVAAPNADQLITLINPRIINESAELDDQYEGCLSFFDVRGKVPRPKSIEVEHQDADGSMRITRFDGGLARLVAHEVDHLDGVLYLSRMAPGVQPIPVSEYRGTGKPWLG